MAEYDGAGVFQRLYVYGNYIDEVLMTDDGTNDYYYAHDHLYSAAALTDSAGDVVERYEYDAYGNVHIMDGNYNSRSSTLYDNPYTFTGRRLDSLDSGNLNIMYYRHRSYYPQLGRFLQHDPLGLYHDSFYNFALLRTMFFIPVNLDTSSTHPKKQYTDGLSLYAYARSIPIYYNDPTGEVVDIAIGAGISCGVCIGCLGGSALGCYLGCKDFDCPKKEMWDCMNDCMRDFWWKRQSSWKMKILRVTCWASCVGCSYLNPIKIPLPKPF